MNLLTNCRVCLEDEEEMFSLFDIYENDLTLANILQKCLSQQVLEEGGFPSNLCSACASLLIQFYNFIIIYEESDSRLQTMVRNAKNVKPIAADFVESNGTISSLKIEENKMCDEDEEDKDSNEECDDFLQTVDIEKQNQSNFNSINVNFHDYSSVIVKTPSNQKKGYNRCLQEPIKCDICNKEFESFFSFKQHCYEHNPETFVCEECGKTFRKKCYLKEHKEVHSHAKPYTCKFCGKSFKQRSVLCKHKQIHTHQNYYICERCGKAFNSKGTLITHIKLLHIKERNFKCNICSETFPLKATLDKHVRRHQKEEKKFECVNCNIKYYDCSSLKRHYLMKHTDIDFSVSCNFCDKKYTTITNLNKHVRKHHPQSISISVL